MTNVSVFTPTICEPSLGTTESDIDRCTANTVLLVGSAVNLCTVAHVVLKRVVAGRLDLACSEPE